MSLDAGERASDSCHFEVKTVTLSTGQVVLDPDLDCECVTDGLSTEIH